VRRGLINTVTSVGVGVAAHGVRVQTEFLADLCAPPRPAARRSWTARVTFKSWRVIIRPARRADRFAVERRKELIGVVRFTRDLLDGQRFRHSQQASG